MADFIAIYEGLNDLLTNGLPSTCTFDLSNKTADEIGKEATYGGGFGKITGTGYAAKTQSEPSPTKGKYVFEKLVWETGTATDWPSGTKSVVLRDGTSNLIAVWNLQAGGTARDMSTAHTKEEFTPTLEGVSA